MPVSLKTVKSSGALVLVRLCEVCGADACFGFGVSLRLALNALADGDIATAKRHLGRWYCWEHRPSAGDPTA